MCLPSSPTPEKTPPPPAPPPPQPELSSAEDTDPTKNRIRRKAEGTEALRVDRTAITTGDPAGLQVSRRKVAPAVGGGV